MAWKKLLYMPASTTKNNYDKINKLCKEAAKQTAEESMAQAASELKEKDTETTDVGVSVDRHGDGEVIRL